MNQSKAVLTRHVGFRISEEVFERIQIQARQERKPANVWCRERVIEAAQHPRISPGERVLLDEIVATQEITINLLYAIVTEGKLSVDRFRQITSSAHATKQKEARKLLEEIQPKPEASQFSTSDPYERPGAKA